MTARLKAELRLIAELRSAFRLHRSYTTPWDTPDRLVLAINKKVPYLLNAMTESDRRTYIDVEHQHIDRPSS